jgi:phosphate-selective porin OprO and OprP
LQLRGGKFKPPVGLELLQPDPDGFFNERALPTDLVPSRDVGFQFHGSIFERLGYAAGIFNGTGDARVSGNSDFEDDKAFAGRLFLEPFKRSEAASLKGFGIGAGSSYEHMQTTNVAGLPNTTGGTLPGYATVGQQQFFAYNPTFGNTATAKAGVAALGAHWRLVPQAYYYYGALGILAEYAISDQQVERTGAAPFTSAHLRHTGWQVSAGWMLTGESASYSGGVTPKHAFNPSKAGWGAWQVVARYSELNIDPSTFPLYADPETSAQSAQEWSVGVNWWLNRNVRVNGSFSHTEFDGGGGLGRTAPANVTQQPENVLFTRVQFAF